MKRVQKIFWKKVNNKLTCYLYLLQIFVVVIIKIYWTVEKKPRSSVFTVVTGKASVTPQLTLTCPCASGEESRGLVAAVRTVCSRVCQSDSRRLTHIRTAAWSIWKYPPAAWRAVEAAGWEAYVTTKVFN